MQHVLESTGTVKRRHGLVSTIFSAYRKHFGLFWRVMLPVIIVSLLINIGVFLFFKFGVSNMEWRLSTSQGISAQSFIFPNDSLSGTDTDFPPGTSTYSVRSGVGFSGSSFDIGLLWLAICPLALIMVCHHQGTNVTSGEVWRRTCRRTVSILGVSILLGVLTFGGFIIFVLLRMTRAFQFLTQGASVGLSTSIFLISVAVGVAAIHFLVKWSLCNQCIIIENLSAVAALRRSGELVRGAWGRFFGIYLLLALVTAVFTTAILILTLLMFSVVSPEFSPLREMLLSEKFFGLFFGSYVAITLPSAPVWAIGVMVTVNILINAVLAPIWAILTTHLYMERAGTPEQDVLG